MLLILPLCGPLPPLQANLARLLPKISAFAVRSTLLSPGLPLGLHALLFQVTVQKATLRTPCPGPEPPILACPAFSKVHGALENEFHSSLCSSLYLEGSTSAVLLAAVP